MSPPGNHTSGDEATVASTQPDITEAAIDRFHQILAEPDIARATWRWLVRAQRAGGLEVQGRPLSQVLRPRLINGADHANSHPGFSGNAPNLSAPSRHGAG